MEILKLVKEESGINLISESLDYDETENSSKEPEVEDSNTDL